jgi:hypothetical protein
MGFDPYAVKAEPLSAEQLALSLVKAEEALCKRFRMEPKVLRLTLPRMLRECEIDEDGDVMHWMSLLTAVME